MLSVYWAVSMYSRRGVLTNEQSPWLATENIRNMARIMLVGCNALPTKSEDRTE